MKQSIYIECYEDECRMLTGGIAGSDAREKESERDGGRTVAADLFRGSQTGYASSYAGTDL